jgi:tetratricopeptide (TPR) repeat protein
MKTWPASVLAFLVVWTPALQAEEPPYKRLLTGADARKAAALEQQANELWVAGKFDEALPPALAVQALRQRVQGEDHWETAQTTQLLVDVLKRGASLPAEQQRQLAEVPGLLGKARDAQGRGRPAEAETLQRRAVAVCEQALGAKHPYTAACYTSLGAYLDFQSKHADAEPLLLKAMAIFEKTLGDKHPLTATSYSNLARHFEFRGKYAAAEPLHRKDLAISEQTMGPRHLDTIASYNNLGANLDYQGRHAEAEPLLRKVVALEAETLGDKHPTTATGYNNLALNLSDQGNYAEAEVLHSRALAIREQVLDPRHPDRAVSYNNVAVNLSHQRKHPEAEALYRKALALRRQVLGNKHTETATSCDNLALCLDEQGKHAEAEPLHKEARAIYREVLGDNHSLTLTSSNNLARNLAEQGKHVEAEPLLRKALALCEQTLGSKHPLTATTSTNLANNLYFRGKYAEAETFHRQALTINEQVLGSKHRRTAAVYRNLALVLEILGKGVEAERSWRAAVPAFEATRLRLAQTGFDRAAAASDFDPHEGLALCLARRGKAAEAWRVAETGLARGLLDDLTARSADPDEERRLHVRAARLDQLDRQLLPLLVAEKLEEADRRRRDELAGQRAALLDEIDREAADLSRKEVYPLDRIRKELTADGALVFWVGQRLLPKATESREEHWACVVRRAGPPVWEKLPGSGPGDTWTREDSELPGRVRAALSRSVETADWEELAGKLRTQRLKPLEPHLQANGTLPAVKHLLVVPTGWMAGVPVEALTDRYTISYTPSATLFARRLEEHRLFRPRALLALADPTFRPAPEKAEDPPEPPDHGVLLGDVLADGTAARAGLREGDVLLRYSGNKLTAAADLIGALRKQDPAAKEVTLAVWRDGKTVEVKVPPGPLGIRLVNRPAGEAVRDRRELEALLERSRGPIHKPLPGTRKEVVSISKLFPESRVLLGSDASEQKLDELIREGRLGKFGVLHLATHGEMDRDSAARSALILADDKLPDPVAEKLADRKVYTGRLTVRTILKGWQLDADLVVLSACETALGPEGGGEGFLGFTQALFEKGARSLVLSLWKVDDTATALLMTRFYENLLGKRDGLKQPLGRAEALTEAKQWLRELPRQDAESLAVALDKGELRGSVSPLKPLAEPPKEAIGQKGDKPFAHAYYWAAFILLGDPD